MNKTIAKKIAKLLTALPLLILSALAFAGGDASDGHTHADDPPPVPVETGAPRAETATADFELVAVQENGRLSLYLNDFASNAPIAGAQVEVEFNGTNLAAKQTAPGVYALALPALSQPGQHALTVSVTAGERADLLLLSLNHAAQNADATTQTLVQRIAHAWPWLVGVAGVIALGMIALGLGIVSRRRKLAGSALAMLVAALFLSAPPEAGAHEGHDHAEEPAAPLAMGSRPQRLPGGGVFMPKTSQFQLGIRTQLAEIAAWPRSLELAGHVQAEPSASAQVQAAQTGRIEPGPRGLPHVGMKVKRGEVLAWLVPVASSLERGSVAAASAELLAAQKLAEKRLARLQELEGSVPAKEIEAAALELEGLRQRKAAVSGSLGHRDALVAPVSGEIAEVKVSIGQVLEARDAAFFIINRERLMIEALAYDAQVAGVRETRAATLKGAPIDVALLGVGAQLKEHALPVQFRVNPAQGTASELVVGQPVKVYVKLKNTTQGVQLPRAALARSPSGGSAVWLKTGAETFALQAVAVEPLDGGNVVVQGLQAGARVVTQGASLLGQVR